MEETKINSVEHFTSKLIKQFDQHNAQKGIKYADDAKGNELLNQFSKWSTHNLLPKL